MTRMNEDKSSNQYMTRSQEDIQGSPTPGNLCGNTTKDPDSVSSWRTTSKDVHDVRSPRPTSTGQKHHCTDSTLQWRKAPSNTSRWILSQTSLSHRGSTRCSRLSTKVAPRQQSSSRA